MQHYENVRTSATAEAKKAKWISQKQRVWRSLYYKPQSRLEVAVAEDIPIQSICRIVGSLRQEGHIRIVRHDTCRISGMRVEIITTAPPAAPGQQGNLFQ